MCVLIAKTHTHKVAHSDEVSRFPPGRASLFWVAVVRCPDYPVGELG